MRRNSNKLLTVFFTNLLFIMLLSYMQIFALPRGSQQPWNENLGNINLFNGNLNTAIPLLNVGGRGEEQTPLVLRLNNKWTKFYYTYLDSYPPGTTKNTRCVMDKEEYAPDVVQCVDDQGFAVNSNSPNPSKLMIFPSLEPSGGLGYGPGTLKGRTMVGSSNLCYFPQPPPGQGPQQSSYRPVATRFFMMFTTPDGSSHELVDQATLGKFRINSSTACGVMSPDSTFSRGNKFVSTDGSAMIFISDSEITEDLGIGDSYGTDPSYGMSGALYLPNGSVYRLDNGLISSIKDRNGNITTFTYYDADTNTGKKRLHTVIDSIGRMVTLEYDVQDVSPYGSCDRITYKGINGENRTLRISKDNLANALQDGNNLQTTSQMWPVTCEGTCSQNFTPVNPVVTSALWLPDGKVYKFQYNSFAEVTRIETPTGGSIEYDHEYTVPKDKNYKDQPLARSVKEKRIYVNANNPASLESKIKYSRVTQYGSPFSVVTVDKTDASNNLLSRTTSYFYGNPLWSYQGSGLPQPPYGMTHWKLGLEFQTDFYGVDRTTLLRRTLNEWMNKSVPWVTDQEAAPSYDTLFTNQATVTIENGQALAVLKKTEYDSNGSSDQDYFSHLNVKKTKAYNYKVLDLNTAQNADLGTVMNLFSESDLASVSEADYLYNAGYKDRHILGLPTETRAMNPASPTQVLAKSQVSFDEQGQYYSMADYGSTTGYEVPTGTYSYLRGNATTHRTWFAEENRWIETHTQYDNFGNMRKMWDSSDDVNRFVETEYSAQYYYAYPTKTISKAPDPTGTRGTSENSTVSTNFDFYTGKPTSITDTNGQVTSMEYDSSLRPKKIIPPAGGGITERDYVDTPGSLSVRTKSQIDAQNWAETTAFFDNLGRVFKTQTKDLQGDIFSEIKYDNFGRVERVSNPYRQGEQKFWSKPRYDNAGRAVETYAPAPDGQTGASMGTVEFGISTIPSLIGNYTTATDASGKKARSITNIYDQVVRVDEPTGNNDLGTLGSPNQPSYYVYNVKGELTKVQQGQQNRYFMYDSLGRLIRVRQPEQTANTNLATTGNPENNQWTSGFTYDVFGNVITVTDAKGLTITNNYDKAGRITTSGYSNNFTPQVDYYYDGTGLGLPQSPQFSKGSLSKISNGVSETRYTSFDNYGRVLANQQITDNQIYNFAYKYDSVGNLTEETYPSMRVVKTLLDADGGLSAVSSKIANGAFKTYASNFSYAASGAVKAMMLGNGRWETATLNERFQPTQIGLGTTAADTSLWKANYDYGELNADGSVDANKNIGMVAKQTITLPTTSFVQTYKYDALNRLKEAKETANTTTGTENWKQTFDYDRYGNRTAFYQKVGNNILTIDNKTKPQIDPATNRFTTGQGYTYDFNGNLIQDAENRGFTYNGDDQQTEVRDLTIQTTQQNPDANLIGRYFYDGEGKRVKKVTNLETTVFVYDAGGALAAEYSTAAPPPTPTTSYLTTDNLGSPRVITDKNGTVISRRDFMPFGEEILAGVGARDTANLKYSASGIDNVRQRFTGYEKDIETGTVDTALDFAEARMYQSRHGRFTSPDPLLSSASLDNPQTFNRYSYVGNNPVNITDPSGLDWCQNANNIAEFVQGACADPKTTVTEATARGSFDTTNGRAYDGDKLILNSNGTTTLANPPLDTGIEARVQVQDTADPIESTAGAISQNITARSLEGTSLPCVPAYQCAGARNIEQIPNPEAAADVASLVLTLCGLIFDPCDVASGAVDAANGDYIGAGLSGSSVIPLAGIPVGATKIARKYKRLSKVADAVGDTEKAVSANSKLSTKAQHLYEVFETSTGNVVKTGISSGKISKADKSYRATSQVNKWNQAEGIGKYGSRVVKRIPAGKGARAKALAAEIKNANKHRKTLLEKFHKVP